MPAFAFYHVLYSLQIHASGVSAAVGGLCVPAFVPAPDRVQLLERQQERGYGGAEQRRDDPGHAQLLVVHPDSIE